MCFAYHFFVFVFFVAFSSRMRPCGCVCVCGGGGGGGARGNVLFLFERGNVLFLFSPLFYNIVVNAPRRPPSHLGHYSYATPTDRLYHHSTAKIRYHSTAKIRYSPFNGQIRRPFLSSTVNFFYKNHLSSNHFLFFYFFNIFYFIYTRASPIHSTHGS